MTKNYKAVLKSSLVMLVLFAVAGSGVAQAQECIARAKDPGMVRAEGLTEVVADIEVRCRRPVAADFGFGSDIPEKLKLVVELSTNITNTISDERVVKLEDADDLPLDYQSGGIDLVATTLDADGGFDANNTGITDDLFGNGELGEDGRMIEWEFNSATAGFASDGPGFNLVISGIRANASMVGDGEDIMVNVMVGGTVVNSTPIKAADVTEGLAVKANAADGAQCADTDDAMATITIQEGFVDAIISMEPASTDEADITAARANSDSLVVTFTGIPEGVAVMVPASVPLAMIENPDANERENMPMVPDPAAFSLMLRSGTRVDGVGDIDADTMMGAVELTASGAGEVIYNLADTDGELNEEWVNLPVTFVWESGGDTPVAIGAGSVDVSFYPVSTAGGVSFDDSKMPRFVESNDPVEVVTIADCVTELLFPFVTNKAGFDTGIAITNTSSDAGSCTINYHGADAPDAMETPEVAAERQTIFLVSKTALDFQGYIMANCGFRGGHGVAFLTNRYGIGEPTIAQSYLAVEIE